MADQKAEGRTRLVSTFTALDDIKDSDEPFWLVDGLVPLAGLVVIAGAKGSGKTALTVDLGLHVATGRAWGGRGVNQGAVAYMAGEGQRGLRRRLIAQRALLGLQGVPFYLRETTPNLGRGSSDLEPLVAEIAAIEQDEPWRLIVVDTLARAMAGSDENSGPDMAALVANCEAIAGQFGCVVVAVHHFGRNASIRGHSSLDAAADAIIEVRREGKSNFRNALAEKIKDGVDQQCLEFSLDPVTLGGVATFSVNAGSWVLPKDEDPHTDALSNDRAGIKLSPQAEKLLAVFGENVGQNGLSGVEVVVREKALPLLSESDKPDSQSKAYRRALKELKNSGIVRISGELFKLLGQPGQLPDKGRTIPLIADSVGRTDNPAPL